MEALFVGCALSDVNSADMPSGLHVPEQLAEYADLYHQRVGTADFSFELQPEEAWTLPVVFPDQFSERKTNRWLRAFRRDSQLAARFRHTAGPIGVHQPIRRRDILSSNPFKKYEAIAETQAAMVFAQSIGADYFVFHLTMSDRWGWDRRDQIEKAVKLLGFFHAFYHASDFSFVPCIEMLKYPQFPATGGEAAALLLRCREVWPEVQLAFDVSHLWGSRERMLAAHMWEFKRKTPVPFLDALQYALEQTWRDVYVYHLGGCWESETHAVPGLHPQQDPFQYPIKLRESPGVYAEMGEIDLNRTLELLLDYSVRRGHPLYLILQIFDRDINQVLEATRVLREELRTRAEPAKPSGPAQVAPSSKNRTRNRKDGRRGQPGK
jgi:hypothetical protein